MRRLKTQLDGIHASDTLRARVRRIVKKRRYGAVSRRLGFTAAAAAVVCVASLNFAPTVAAAAYEVPVLGAVARVVTLNRFAYQDGGYEVSVNVPKIEGLLSPELEAEINQDFQDQADAVIAAFETDMRELKAEFGEETVHYGLRSDYEVKTDTQDILVIDNYLYFASGSSSTVHSFYTIDKRSGVLLTLKGLFQEDTDYVGVLSSYIQQEMERRNREENGMFWVGQDEVENFERISEDQNFYLNSDNQLVICFDKYEVAAGAQGSPEFVIPTDVIADIAAFDLLK